MAKYSSLEILSPFARIASRFLATIALLGGLTSAGASLQPTSPRPGLEVGYQPFFEIWERAPAEPSSDEEGQFIISAGHGRPPIFAVSLPGPNLNRAEVRTPGDLDGYDLLYRSPELPHPSPQNDFERAENDLERLHLAIEHHRPAVTLLRTGSGFRRTGSLNLSRYQVCARRRLASEERSVARAAALQQEQTGSRPSSYRRGLRTSPLPAAEAFLRLLDLQLPPVQEGRLARAARVRIEGRAPDDRPSQQTVRDRQLSTFAVESQLELDLLRVRTSAAAQICRSISLRIEMDLRRDYCRISAAVDPRDGWPIFMSVLREQESRRGGKQGRVDFYSRLIPTQGFVPPPNPCPAA